MNFLSLFLRLFFRLLYSNLAWTYDFISAVVSGRRWDAWRDRVIPFLQGPKVLELGFGPGHLLQKFPTGGFVGFGIDASRQMARLASKNLRSTSLASHLVCAVGEHLPFRPSIFNCVVATFPTNYIFLPFTLSEIKRVLLPGGRLVILLSAWITDRSLSSQFLAWLFRFTGQVFPDQQLQQNLLTPFQTAGFISRLEWVDLPGSRLLIIISTKP